MAITKTVSPLYVNSPASGLRLTLQAGFVGSMRPGLNDSSGTPPLFTTVVFVEVPPGRSTNATPRSVRNMNATRMFPPGSPPSWSFTGLIWRQSNTSVRRPSEWRDERVQRVVASTTPLSVGPLLSWISSSARMSGDFMLVDDLVRQRVELRGAVARVEVLDVEGRDGELVRRARAVTSRVRPSATLVSGDGDLQLEVAEVVVDDADSGVG